MNAFDIVVTEVLRVAGFVQREQVRPESKLTDHLGLDSMTFVELTVGLEDAFGFVEFPMQQWVDDCKERDEPLTIGSLVAACEQLRRRTGRHD